MFSTVFVKVALFEKRPLLVPEMEPKGSQMKPKRDPKRTRSRTEGARGLIFHDPSPRRLSRSISGPFRPRKRTSLGPHSRPRVHQKGTRFSIEFWGSKKEAGTFIFPPGVPLILRGPGPQYIIRYMFVLCCCMCGCI